jgi:hypothetical protein
MADKNEQLQMKTVLARPLQSGVRLPGKATHYQPENDRVTLCGRVGVEYKTDKKKEVDCYQCRRTRAWRAS